MSGGLNKSRNEMVFSIQHSNHQESPKERKKATREFRRYLKDVFSESLIPMFPQIADSRTWKKTISKAAILVFCLLGCLYQTLDFLQYYFEYPVTVNVEESTPFEVNPPAYTFCNKNHINRLAWCEINNCKTYDNVELFCEKFPRYCYEGLKEEQMKIPIEEYGDYSDSMDWKEAKILSPANDDLFAYCEFNYGENMEQENCKLRLVPFTDVANIPHFCHTFNSQLGEPDAETVMYPNSLYIYMQLRIHPENYLFHDIPAIMYVSVHDSKQLVNPLRDGFELRGGEQYHAYVTTMTEVERLPPPYSTNCFDYIKAWRENNGSGPTTQSECIEHCSMAKVLLKGQCIDPKITVSHSENLCAFEDSVRDPTTTDEIVKNCTQHCQPACLERIYEVEYRKLEDNSNSHCNDGTLLDNEKNENFSVAENCKIRQVGLDTYFRKLRLKRQIYQAKYNSVELFSFVGGYLGLWLGISLVSIFDLFESLGKVLHYALNKRGSIRLKAPVHGIKLV